MESFASREGIGNLSAERVWRNANVGQSSTQGLMPDKG